MMVTVLSAAELPVERRHHLQAMARVRGDVHVHRGQGDGTPTPLPRIRIDPWTTRRGGRVVRGDLGPAPAADDEDGGGQSTQERE